MAACVSEVSVFADTNLGTRIAMNVPLEITAGAFKRDFERVHFACIPNSGEIQVNGLMVKRKSCFYCLPDSLPLKYVFHGMRKMWFLRVEVRHLKKLHGPCLTQTVATLSKPQDLENSNIIDKANGKRKDMRREGCDHLKFSPEPHGSVVHILNKKKKKKRGAFTENYMPNIVIETSEGYSHGLENSSANKSQYIMIENGVENMEGCNANSMQESLGEMSTEVISVTGIINKYFPSSNVADNLGSPSCSDVTSRAVQSEVKEQSKTKANSCSKKQTDSLSHFTPRTPPSVLRAPLYADVGSKTSRNKSRSKVGKCLLVASQNLGMSTNEHSPAICVSRYRDGKLLGLNSSQINGSLFEISDNED